MDVRSFSELTTADERTLRFTSYGFSLGGQLSPDDAAHTQQRDIASADLADVVPTTVRDSFERLRGCHSYGVLWYEAFSVAFDLCFVVLEHALRERFVGFYGGSIPVVSRAGEHADVTVAKFEELDGRLRALVGMTGGGRRAQLRPRAPGPPIPVPRTLDSLLRWARREGLLTGQRNKRMEPLLAPARNRFAHGAAPDEVLPIDSARRIRDVAEIVNRLWGVATPGGRLYPAPLTREVVAVAWRTDSDRPSVAVFRPDRIPQRLDREGDDWTHLLVLAVPTDDRLHEFDAGYERTRFPSHLLWGPGDGTAAFEWWERNAPITDDVEYLDRLFVVRVGDDGRIGLPRRPDVVLGLPPERRAGAWNVVRADFPLDAFAHVRGCASGAVDADDDGPAELIAHGAWDEIRDLLAGDGWSPPHSVDVRVPRLFALPVDVEDE